MITTVLPLLLSLAVPALSLPTPQSSSSPSAECTREKLEAQAFKYIAAQASGNVTTLSSAGLQLSPTLEYYEDGVLRADIAQTSLATPLRIDHKRTILDTTQCATYTELIVADPANPRVIGTQLRFDPTASVLGHVWSLVTQPGDWAFNATQTLYYAAREDGLWGPIPEADRDSRDVIQAAGDAYLDLFNDPDVVVPWGLPCHRLEGGWYTGNGSATDSCDVGVPTGVPITERKYVIDEVLGTVDAMVTFGTRPDSHEFRVEKGKLRFVHTLTVMRNVTA